MKTLLKSTHEHQRASPLYLFGGGIVVLACYQMEQLTNMTMALGAVYLLWIVKTCVSVLSFETQNPYPIIPETERQPREGKKWDDYDYSTDVSNTNIFFFMWLAQMNCLIAPYEILILDLSNEDALCAQELNHAQMSTNWNKRLEEQYGCPFYSFWQKRVWKNIMFNYLRPLSNTFNLAIGCALEAMFCWVVYVFTWSNGFIYDRMNLRSWIWSFHLLEEVEHTHLSVPEMRNELSTLTLFSTWLFFDVCVVAPIMLILTPIAVARYFPRRFFHPCIAIEFLEYLLFVAFSVPFVIVGQLCEMVLCLNWKASALQELWKQWYEKNYKLDCYDKLGNELFTHRKPNHGHGHGHGALGDENCFSSFELPKHAAKLASED